MKPLSKCLVGFAMLVASSGLGWAQAVDLKPIPVAPGGNVEAEISFTNQDLLPLFKKLLDTASNMKLPPQAPPQAQAMLSQLNPKDLADALQGLEAVQFVTYTLSMSDDNIQKVADFYAKTVDTSKLRKVVAVRPDPKTSIQVYAGTGLAMFGLVVVREGNNRDRVLAGELRGNVDVDKLMGFVGRVGEMAMTMGVHRMGQPSVATPQAAPTTQKK